MKTLSLLAAALCVSFGAAAQVFPLDNPNFSSAFPLKANGEVITVNTGHAAPYIYDFNQDGVDDLLVGEFGIEDFDGVIEGISHEYVQGRCRIYLNHGTNEAPVYKDFSWLSAQGQPMKVPVTCCISFVPRFADMDADGIDDVISGSYTGDIYFWKGLGNREFAESIIIKDKDGGDIHPYISMAVNAVDWDEDGDLDLLITSRTSGIALVENSGTRESFAFEKPRHIDLKGHKRLSAISYLAPHDWDMDGLFDLVGGTEEGELVWYKNTGKHGEPEFLEPVPLWSKDEEDIIRTELKPMGGRVKIWIYDYNHDGKEDILAGDVNTKHTVIRELTVKEKMEKKNVELKLQKNEDKFAKKHPDLYAKYKVKEYPVGHKEYFNFVKRSAIIGMDLQRIMDSYLKSETTGNVWVFIRK